MEPLIIPDVLDPATVQRVRAELRGATWENGQATAGPIAASVKENLQARETDAIRATRVGLVSVLSQHALFNAFVKPHTMGLMFSRYDAPTGAYGRHVDAASLGKTRRDVSFTIMLSSHDEYEGGILTIGDDDMRRYKLAQGAMIVYPATSLHEVTPVTRGSRIVAVGWARSYIRDAAQRELLFELEVSRASLFDQLGKTREVDLLSKCAANLMRMWMDD